MTHVTINLDPKKVANDIAASIRPVIAREIDAIARKIEAGKAAGSTASERT